MYQNKTSPKVSPSVNFGVKINIIPVLLSAKHAINRRQFHHRKQCAFLEVRSHEKQN